MLCLLIGCGDFATPIPDKGPVITGLSVFWFSEAYEKITGASFAEWKASVGG